MSNPSYQPLSVRTGQRNPLPYHEGAPDHLRGLLEDVIFDFINGYSDEDLADPLILQLQIPRAHWNTDAVSTIHRYCQDDETALLDVLDYILATVEPHDATDAASQPGIIGDVARILNLGASVWEVTITTLASETAATQTAVMIWSPYRAGLRRRVPETEQQAYLSALGIGGQAEQNLRTAWRAAYGRPADSMAAWQYAAKAVEAALQPIVEPNNEQARLGAMRAKILQGPHNFRCKLPLWSKGDADTPVQAFTQGLSRVIYESGRHGADTGVPTQDQAQAVLAQAVTICEWIRIGIFSRARD